MGDTHSIRCLEAPFVRFVKWLAFTFSFNGADTSAIHKSSLINVGRYAFALFNPLYTFLAKYRDQIGTF